MTQDWHGARYTESQKCRRAGWRGLEKRAQRENYYPKWCKTRDNVKPRGLCQSYCTAWGGVISRWEPQEEDWLQRREHRAEAG